MRCGHLWAPSCRRSGSGWFKTKKPVRLWDAPWGIGLQKRLKSCGIPCQPFIGNARLSTRISRMPAPWCCPPNATKLSARKPAKPAISSALTTRFVSVFPAWAAKPCLSRKNSNTTKQPYGISSTTTTLPSGPSYHHDFHRTTAFFNTHLKDVSTSS